MVRNFPYHFFCGKREAGSGKHKDERWIMTDDRWPVTGNESQVMDLTGTWELQQIIYTGITLCG
ncbi:MAG: hypothetical protein ACOC1J_00865 [Prolixibacteraceae bacterium]